MQVEMKKSEMAVRLIDAANQAWADGNSPFCTSKEYAECLCLLCDLYRASKKEEAAEHD